MKVAVVGAGSWGTAFATIPASSGVDTVVWARREEIAKTIAERHECPDYLPGVELPPSLTATHDMERALDSAEIVVMAVPSHAFRDVVREVSLVAIKGLCRGWHARRGGQRSAPS